MLDMLSVQGNAKLPWADRVEKAFFRGRDSHKQRLQLTRMAKRHPELVDAGITNYFFFKDLKEELGSAPYSSLYNFFKFKYQASYFRATCGVF